MSTVNKISLFKGKTVNKLLVILFTVLICSVVIITSSDDSVGEEDFNFTSKVIEGDTAEITGYTGLYLGEQFSIPEEVTIGSEKYDVTSVGDNAFEGHQEFVSLYIPDNVTNIGDNAFSDCTSLVLVIVPDFITIGTDVFEGCTKLISLVVYGDTLTDYTSLINKLPTTVSTIGINSGALVEVDKITALKNITMIGFTDVSAAIVTMEFTFKDFDGTTITDLRGKVFEADTRTTWNQICTIEPSDPNIEYHLDWTNITAEVSSFSNSDVTDAVIDRYIIVDGVVAKVTSIGDSAFEDRTNLTEITIPDSVTSIGDGAFYNCSGLTEITIPDSVTSIGDNAFYNCSGLTALIMPIDISITNGMFRNCSNLMSVTLTEGETGIGALYSYSPKDDNCYENTPWYMSNLNLLSLTIMNGVTTIGDYTFSECVLEEIIIPESVITIGEGAFEKSSITSIFIPDSVMNIGICAFADCADLATVTISINVTTIDDYTFAGCIGLISLVMSENVTTIGDYAFEYCTSLTSFTVGIKVESIGEYAFENCHSLVHVIKGNNIKTIGKNAFSGCSELTTITIPESITSIGDGAFSDCTFYSPNGINEIPKTEFDLKGHTYSEVNGKKLVQLINIIWIVDGIPENKTMEVAFDTMPVYGIDPTKAADLLNTYEFKGWAPALTATVTGNATYVAQFEHIPIVYVITWTIGESSVNENFNSGADLAYTGAAPTKAADLLNTYEFKGWAPALTTTVTGNATYVAQFEHIPIVYVITWTIGESSVNENFNSGADLAYTGAAPTKAADLLNTYEFKGWAPALTTTVTGNATYVAQFEHIPIVYVITWTIGESSVNENFNSGADLAYTGAAPTKAADLLNTYEFKGWAPALTTTVTGNATYVAQFEHIPIVYVITWTIGESSVNENFNSGADLAYTGAAPTKAADLLNTYEFKGWAPALTTTVTGNATYVAQFEHIPIVYVITWTIGESSVNENFNSGADLAYTGAAPTKAADLLNTYEFKGWAPALTTTVTGNATYVAQFEHIPIVYVITWTIGESSVNENFNSGADLAYTGAAPTKAADLLNTYEFKGWAPALTTTVTGNATYVAQWNETANKYTITFNAENGDELTTGDFDYGTTIVAPSTPTKAADDQYVGYTFAGWELASASGTYFVTGDKVSMNETYTAAFTPGDLQKYTITFTDGSNVTSRIIEFGADIIAPSNPIKTSTDTEVFTGSWDGYIAGMKVTADQNFDAKFTSAARTYTISWIIDGVTTTELLNYGTILNPAAPTKTATAQYTYTFTTWSPALANVTEDATYTAGFSEAINKYTVTFNDENGNEIISGPHNYGVTVTPPTPVKPGDDQFTSYTLSWTPSGVYTVTTPVADDMTFTAKFTGVGLKQYTIIFNDANGEVYNQSLAFGTVIPAQTATVKAGDAEYAGYSFTEWKSGSTVYVAGMTVSKDLTFVAEYAPVGSVLEYTITWKVDGLEHTTQVAYGILPIYETDVDQTKFTYKKIVWDSEIVIVTESTTYTATVFDKVLRLSVLNIETILNSEFNNLEDNSLIIEVMEEDGVTLAYSWTFKGPYKVNGVTTFDAGISKNKQNDELNEAINSANIENTLILYFETSGVLPIEALIKYRVDDKYTSGSEISLFLYNEDTKQLETQPQVVTVTEDGFVEFKLTHCSYYVLAEISPDVENYTMLYVGIAIILMIVAFITIVAIRPEDIV